MRISDWSSDVCSSDLEPLLLRIARGRQCEPPDDFGLSRLQVVERRHVGLRHEQHVHRRLRGDIAERDDVVVFVDDVGRDLAADDLVRSEEHTSELQSLMRISYAVFCLKKKTKIITTS